MQLIDSIFKLRRASANRSSPPLTNRLPDIRKREVSFDVSLANPVIESEIAGKMLLFVNKERVLCRLQPLRWNQKLANIALAYSHQMYYGRFFAHISPVTGSQLTDRIAGAFPEFRASGENLAINQSVENAHYRLMQSEGHRQNILNSQYEECGIGIVRDGAGNIIVTQLFIKL